MLNTRAGWPRIFSLRYNLLLFGLMLLALVWLHLTSSSSSFNIQNDVGLHRHRHKSIISHHFKVWWCQAITSLWHVRASSNRHFYQSRQWPLPLLRISPLFEFWIFFSKKLNLFNIIIIVCKVKFSINILN